MMEKRKKKVNQQATIKGKNSTLKRPFCRIIGELWIHGIAFGFLWCWGVFGSLSHFRQCRPTLGAVQMGSCVEKWAASNHSLFPPTPPPPLLCCSVYLCLSLHLLYLSLSTPFFGFYPLSTPHIPHSLFIPPWWLCCGCGVGLGGWPLQNMFTEMQGRISGSCYRKICPFTLCCAARPANGGRVTEEHEGFAFCFGQLFYPSRRKIHPGLREYWHTELSICI